jgi:hypothetical protein
MGPAEREADVAFLGERAIAGITVDLENALETGEMRNRLRRRPVGSIDIGDGRQVRAAPRAIVPRIGPELPCLRAAPPRIEHRRRRLVSEQLRRRSKMRENALSDRP